jgi:gamma-glutamyltranspeptidase / glutathione hydrolase
MTSDSNHPRSGTFPRGAVATPNHHATYAGRDVLAAGGNAVDAVVAAGLVLAVVTPYHCGLGGDVLAMVWDGGPRGLLSVGAAPAGADSDQVRAALAARRATGAEDIPSLPGTGGMPDRGALSVTVPGAVAGWIALLEEHGSWSFARVAEHAIRFAEEGFVVSEFASTSVTRSRPRLGEEPGWEQTFGGMRAGERFVQPTLARTLRAIADGGASAFYEGDIAAAIARTLADHGSAMTAEDIAAHRPEWVEPLSGTYRGLTVLELPPPTQGISVLTALAILEELGPLPDDPVEALHLQVEAVRASMADRQEHVGDPTTMRTTPEELLAPGRIARIAASVDRTRAGTWPTARPAPGGTAYLCAADADGRMVSLIQSNFKGFGSGVVVTEGGFGLHNRGSHLSLDPDDANAIGPRRRPLHTLVPALVLEDGAPRYVMGTMGGDAQAQVHVQMLGHLRDRGRGLAETLEQPRFVVEVGDGSVALEPETDPALAAGLAALGHVVTTLPDPALAGHAHLIAPRPHGYDVASDPRCDGAASGV